MQCTAAPLCGGVARLAASGDESPSQAPHQLHDQFGVGLIDAAVRLAALQGAVFMVERAAACDSHTSLRS